MKVVINRCFGGFGLSEKAVELGRELSGDPSWGDSPWDMERNDATLVQVVETLKADADGAFSDLKVVEVPDDVEWTISEHDGLEHVSQRHRTWS